MPLSLPEAAVLHSAPAVASRPAWKALGALRLRGAASGVELVEETAKRGHCFHQEAGQAGVTHQNLTSKAASWLSGQE